MKKWVNKQTIAAFMLGAILFSGVSVGAATCFQFTLSPFALYVNDEKVDEPLYIYENSNYIPLRAASEAFDMNVKVEGKRIDISSKPTGIEEVAKNVESCVLIRVYSTADPVTAELVGTASGVVITDGIIVTNKHVLEAGKMYGIQFNDTPAGLDYKVTETYTVNTNLDIGFIKSPVNVATVEIGDSDETSIGQDVIAISSPGGLKNNTAKGIVSGLSDDIDGQTMQINADINRGSSGGGIFNMQGELIGIVCSGLDEDYRYNYVIPINNIKPLLDKIEH